MKHLKLFKQRLVLLIVFTFLLNTNLFSQNNPTFTSTAITTVSENAVYSYTIGTTDADGDQVTVSATTLPNWLRLTAATVSTFAGSMSGTVDGTGTAAQFSRPTGVALDGLGNLYVADAANHRIRKISPAGVVTTLAGSTRGFANGTGTAAQFSDPTGVAVDASGNIFVADSENNKIRKISPTGVVSTFAGSGDFGSANGTGTDAQFNTPTEVALDGLGNVYVIDPDRVRKISPTGVVTTLAGPEFSFATGVAVDGSGNVYVVDRGNYRIQKITATGVVSTFAGSGDYESSDGTGTSAGFGDPIGVAVDASGNVYVTDSNLLRKISPNGVVTTLAGGSPGSNDGAGTDAEFNQPTGLAVDASGNIYVADTGNDKIRKIAQEFTLAGLSTGQTGDHNVVLTADDGKDGTVDQSFTIGINEAPTFTSSPITSSVQGSNYSYAITTTDTDNDVVTLTAPTLPAWLSLTSQMSGGTIVYSLTGNSTGQTGTHNVVLTANDGNGNVTNQSFVININIAVPTFTTSPVTTVNEDAAYNYVIGTSDADGDEVTVSATTLPNWLTLTTARVSTLASEGFDEPTGIAVDASGNAYVTDQDNGTILKITPAGVVNVFAGGIRGFADGTGTDAQFNFPNGVAVDASGNIYVADTGNDKIRKISPTGVVSTFAGSTRGFANGTGTAAQFSDPTGVAVDASGNIYVADGSNSKIRKITPIGVVTTFAGSDHGVDDGTGTSAQFRRPSGVAVDVSGNVYVADPDLRLRKISPAGVVTTFGFDQATGITVDASGNVYVIESGRNEIIKISPTGVRSTLAGSTSSGFNDGVGTDARFNRLEGVAVDAAGNIFVVDKGNTAIRRIGREFELTGNSTGQTGDHDVVLTADDGNSGRVDQSFTIRINTIPTFTSSPITSSVQGSVYSYAITTTDTDNNTVTLTAPTLPPWLSLNSIRIPGGTIVYELTGNSAGQTGIHDVVLTANDGQGGVENQSFVIKINLAPPTFTSTPKTAIGQSSTYNYIITTNDLDGDAVTITAPTLPFWLSLEISTFKTTTIAGSAEDDGTADGNGTSARFYEPLGIALDAAGNIYVADTENNIIRKITPNGDVTTIAGANERRPSGKKTVGGETVDGNGTDARFNSPEGVALDAAGNIYVADRRNDIIRKITPNGDVTTIAGATDNEGTADGNGTSARFYGPSGIALDAAGNIYVADTDNHTIRKITPNGDVTTIAGDNENDGTADGNGTSARFYEPEGIAVDAAGNVYVADTDNHTIRKITPNGDVTTIAGAAEDDGTADGNGTSARFYYPKGIAVDAAGNIYVADTENHTIRKITPNGDVTTIAGAAEDDGTADGNGTSARFYEPEGIAVDAAGNIYVADTDNHTIRKVTPEFKLTGDSPAQIGDHNVVLTADDGKGLTVNQSFTINVIANAAPTFTSTAITTVEGGAAYSYLVVATDTDGDPLTISTTTLPNWLSLTTVSGVSTLAGTPTSTEVGTHNVVLQVSDGKGGMDMQSFTVTVSDVTAPTVTNVSSAKADGTYGTGEAITISITFSETVIVIGTPQLELETGAVDRTIDYTSGSGTNTLNFAYMTQSGDESSDLDYKATTSLALNGGTIKDGAGNDATLTLTAPGTANSLGDNKALVIDVVAPTVTVSLDDTALKSGETATVTITFSEVVTGFDNADLTIPNGTMTAVSSADGGKTYTATYTPTASTEDATNVITVDNTGVADVIGNPGVGTTDSGNFTIDTKAPTVTVSLDDTALKSGETATVTITFSEVVTGFDNTDLTIPNGTMTAVSSADGGTTYTATYTPTASTEDATNVITVDNTGVVDGAGNAGSGTTGSGNFTIETTIPTVTVSLDDTALKSGETAMVTITFSEVVTGFDNADLTIPNGTMTAVSSADGGTTYTATFTPTASLEDATNVITVAKSGVTDAAGNAGVSTTDSGNFTIDTKAPTVTVSLDDTALKSGETATVTITFSEVVTGFDNADLTIPNGTMTAVSSADGGTTYTATYTPTASTEDATNVITVANTGVADVVGNAGTGTTDSGNFTIDTKAPTVTVSLDDIALKSGETATVTITFSEVVTGFDNADLTIPNGTMTAVSSADGGKTYTATFTPTAGVEDVTNVITVDNTGVTGAAGNAGTSTTDSPNFTIDTQGPTVTVVLADAALTAGETSLVTITFSEVVTGFDNADLTIPNGTMTAVSSADGGTTYTATYTPTASTEDATNVITVANTGVADVVGNAGSGTTDSGNFTIDTQGPTVTVVLADAALTAGETSLVTITFSEVVTGFDNADLTIPNGTMTAVSSADGGKTYTATYSPTASVEDATNVITVDNTGVTDVAGNAGVGTTDSGNLTIDTQAPTVAVVLADAALTAGETSLATITFSEVVTGFDNADLTIPNGTMTAVSSADGGTTYTATFTPTTSVEDVTNAITVDNTGVTDAAGNAGTGTTDSGNFTIDTQGPTVTVVLADAALTAGETSLVTVTFSEVVTGFDNADLTIPNGTMTAVSSADGGTTYTATYTPSASTEDATNVITVDNTGVADAAGNAGVSTTDSGNFTIDTQGPTVTVVLADAALTAGETSLVTITFSEVVTGFANADLTIPNGTMTAVSSADGGVTYTATYTPSASTEDATNVITVDNTGVADAAGNAGVSTTDSGNFTIDTKAPTVTVSLDDTALKSGETATVTITFSEVVTGFANADLTIPNGTMTAVSSADGGTTYTATYTPTADIEDATNVITVANTAVVDAAGNAGVSTTDSGNFTIDTKAPTVTVSLDDIALKSGETATVTITFSEVVTGFDNADLTIPNGTMTAVSSADGGTTYTATYTPTTGVEDATNVITVDNTGVADAASNAGAATTSSSNFTIDTKAPKVSSITRLSLTSGPIIVTYKVSFNEAVFNVDAADFEVIAGLGVTATIGALTQNSTTEYTLTVSGISGDGLLRIRNKTGSDITDTAGNVLNDEVESEEAFSLNTDQPLVSITSSESSPSSTSPIPIDICFDKEVTGFTASDLSVVNGSAGVLSSKPVLSHVFTKGSFGTGNGEFNKPRSIGVDPGGNVYVLDRDNSRIQKFDADGVFIKSVGSAGSGNNEFSLPLSLAVGPLARVYVVDRNNFRVQVFDHELNYLFTIGSNGSGDGEFLRPREVFVDASGKVYVSDQNRDDIQVFDQTGAFLFKFGSTGTSDGQFMTPAGIAVNSAGDIYVTDVTRQDVQRFNSTGVFQSKFGSLGSGDGEFNGPQRLAISNKYVFVSDFNNDRIQYFDLAGVYIGQFGSSGGGDGEFDEVVGLALGDDYTLYTTETSNNRFQKFKLRECYQTTITPNASGTVTVDVNSDVVTDDFGNGNVAATQFSIVYNNIPTEITLSSGSILENNAVGDLVGTLTSTDADAGDTHSYTLVSGTGDTDNGSFTVSGDELKAAVVFDREVKSSYDIRVRVTDNHGGTFDKQFTITIDNVAEADLRITGNNDIPATPLGITTSFDITIHNDGDAQLTVSNILYPTAFGGPVTGITVAAGMSQVVTMNFTPTLPQLYTGDITITTNGGTGTLAVSADGAVITSVDRGVLSADAINVYPNPASRIVTFDLSKFNGRPLQIQLFDVSGNRTFDINDYKEDALRLNISSYRQGIYLAYFTDGKDVVQKKFMIKK